MPQTHFHIRQKNENQLKKLNAKKCERRIEQLRTHMGTLRLLVKYLTKEEKHTTQSRFELKKYKNRLYSYENEMRHINRKLLHINSQ